MEPLSGAASVIAVASLSLQLIDTVNTIRHFVQNVKDAPKELSRLGDLLDRLGALLQDIRVSMDNQKSLVGQHIPTPSMSVSQSLKACEKSLEPLLALVKKFQDPKAHGSSTMSRLKSDIRLGLKTKDIAEFETRIQQEINYLQTALIMNMTNVVTSTNIVYNQQTVVSSQSSSSCQILSQQNTYNILGRKHIPASRPSSVRLSQSAFPAPSSLDRFGVHKQSLIRYMHSQNNSRGMQTDGRQTTDGHHTTDAEDIIVSEEHQYFWTWKFLGFGLHWNQRRETIIPSLTVYPVLPDLRSIVSTTMRSGDVLEFQRLLSSGSLHPFTRDLQGRSLLHIASEYQRGDFCRLLSSYGLRPDLTLDGKTPLYYAMDSVYEYKRVQSRRDASIDTLRDLLESSHNIDDFEGSEWTDLPLLIADSSQITDWLWDCVNRVYSGPGLLAFQSMVYRDIAYNCSRPIVKDELTTTLQVMVPKLTSSGSLLEKISLGNTGALAELYDNYEEESTSQEIGKVYIDLLESMGIDVESSIRAELEKLPGGILATPTNKLLRKKILFYPEDGQNWTLRWEWLLDKEAVGYDLLAEFFSMTVNESYGGFWPFHELVWSIEHNNFLPLQSNLDARGARRRANTARKELARTGQKRQRSKMPGSWV